MSKMAGHPAHLLPLEEGVFAIPLWLDHRLEGLRGGLQAQIGQAQRQLLAFAQQHDWSVHMREPLARKVVIFAEKKEFDTEIRRLFQLGPEFEIPETHCATLHQEQLLTVSPALFTELYPTGIEPDSFTKLLVHELAHWLHIRLLAGNEEAMGPIWFYEGFALNAAGQLKQHAPALTPAEIWAIARSDERLSYQNYVTVFTYFQQFASLPELVARAGDESFLDWLKTKGA